MATTALVTFGDAKFSAALDRIKREAEESGLFDAIHMNRPEDLGPEFWQRHGQFVATNKRGYGYWVWKPQLILDTLWASAEGDILVWLDAGCTIRPGGAQRFQDYCRLAAESPCGVLGFQTTYPERRWTKGDLFDRLDAWPHADTGQVCSGIIVFQNCAAARDLLAAWSDLMSDYQLISDRPSVVANAPDFEEHRHDQSIFSLLCKQRQATLLPDEPQPGLRSDAPFVAVRAKGAYSRPFPSLRRWLSVARLRMS